MRAIHLHFSGAGDVPIARHLREVPNAPEIFQQFFVGWVFSQPHVNLVVVLLRGLSGQVA